MPVIKYDDIKMDQIDMEGAENILKSNVIGSPQGWKDYTLRVFRIKSGGYSPHHQHEWEHINYVMSGRGTLTIGDETKEIKKGDFALVPGNTIHQFKNPFDEEFEFICIVPNKGA
ncbi:MAG: cupin domain-containing protein [candidate division Zixibacteria bacterium]|nr:cupin domain-containing protein [candidate division Zixibacteria bacterium]NIT51624.1 cupin domain-containing protein [candidate division Zixibacteria bacterium]NIU07988.1 cupin domain-containing protein [Phycisphaerae bacterium]NIW39496.1 cupin domain-containing protein [candidate division Zixibacteria bacterium]